MDSATIAIPSNFLTIDDRLAQLVVILASISGAVAMVSILTTAWKCLCDEYKYFLITGSIYLFNCYCQVICYALQQRQQL